jgi:hypothetical protein
MYTPWSTVVLEYVCTKILLTQWTGKIPSIHQIRDSPCELKHHRYRGILKRMTGSCVGMVFQLVTTTGKPRGIFGTGVVPAELDRSSEADGSI